MRATFIKILDALADADKNIMIMVGDLGKFFDSFIKNHPKQFLNAGIAEANMIGTAAGLALGGKRVYCYSIANFMALRALEQIRFDVCYHNLNVTFLAAGGGLSYGLEGMTHHATEDVAVLRALPNMTIISPGDPVELKELALDSYKHQGPVYFRFSQDNRPVLHDLNTSIKIGRGIVMQNGDSGCAVISNGSTLHPTKLAIDELKKRGLNLTLVSMPTIKPLDNELIAKLAKEHQKIMVIEEHSTIGGLGDAVGSSLWEAGYTGKFKKLGLPDAYTVHSGCYTHINSCYGLCQNSIFDFIVKEFNLNN